MKVCIYQALEALLQRIAEWAETARQRVAICPDCGENRYTGKACSTLYFPPK
jgi:hypothetical protein